MDISNFIPQIAAALGVQPSTLLFLIMVITTLANTIARRIPDTATGWLGTVKTICSIIGVRVENRVAPGVTTSDVTKASLAVPVIAENAYANSDLMPSPDSRARNGSEGPATRLVGIDKLKAEREQLDQDDVAMFPPAALEAEIEKAVPTSADVMRAGGVDPDAPFERGPFPSDMRLVPNIPGDALSVPVIDLRSPPPQKGK